jgi:L-amino acid N-acyltransferase YncA
MLIRKAVGNDAPALAGIHVDTWRSAYRGLIADAFLERLDHRRSEQQWRTHLEGPTGATGRGGAVLVAQDEVGGVVGFASVGPNRGEDAEYDAELYAIYVLPEYQRRGTGRMLVREAASSLLDLGYRSMIVWVLTLNPFRSFYAKMNGRELGRRELAIGGVQYEVTAYGWSDLSVLWCSLQALPEPPVT